MFNPLERGAPSPGFTLDKREMARRRMGMNRREWRLLITLPLALAALVLVAQYFIGLAKNITGTHSEFPEERIIGPMERPLLDQAPPLPSSQEIAASRPLVKELMANRAGIRHSRQLDAATLAWAGELMTEDRASPPITQRMTGRELVLGEAREGAPLLIEGRLDFAVSDTTDDGGEGLERQVIGTEDGQYLQVLAPRETKSLVIGRQVQVLGRYLGESELPTGAGSATVALPLVAASVVRPIERRAEEDAFSAFQGALPRAIPPDLYQDVSDERVVIETRPYFTTLALVKGDLAEPESLTQPKDGNWNANQIHMEPDQHRGETYRITGYVYRAWEDEEVARAKPWGIQRVVRVLLWSRDFGEVTELVNNKKEIKSRILRLYELAMITDQPLPDRLDRITATGRYFKRRAIYVKPNPQRDRELGIQRQSDKVYPFFFVTGPYTSIPPPHRYQLSLMAWVILGVVFLLAALLTVMAIRDRKASSGMQGQIRKLRSTRRNLALKGGVQPSDPPAPPPAG